MKPAKKESVKAKVQASKGNDTESTRKRKQPAKLKESANSTWNLFVLYNNETNYYR